MAQIYAVVGVTASLSIIGLLFVIIFGMLMEALDSWCMDLKVKNTIAALTMLYMASCFFIAFVIVCLELSPVLYLFLL